MTIEALALLVGFLLPFTGIGIYVMGKNAAKRWSPLGKNEPPPDPPRPDGGGPYRT